MREPTPRVNRSHVTEGQTGAVAEDTSVTVIEERLLGRLSSGGRAGVLVSTCP